jgi:hypothetical protein
MEDRLFWNITSWTLLLVQIAGFTLFFFSRFGRVQDNLDGYSLVYWMIFGLSWSAGIARAFSRKGQAACFILAGIMATIFRMFFEFGRTGFSKVMVILESIFVPAVIISLCIANKHLNEPKVKDQ